MSRCVVSEPEGLSLNRSGGHLLPFRAFHHLVEPEQQRSCLQSIHRALVPRGHLVIDMFDPLLEGCVPRAPSPYPDRRAVDPQTGHTIGGLSP